MVDAFNNTSGSKRKKIGSMSLKFFFFFFKDTSSTNDAFEEFSRECAIVCSLFMVADLEDIQREITGLLKKSEELQLTSIHESLLDFNHNQFVQVAPLRDALKKWIDNILHGPPPVPLLREKLKKLGSSLRRVLAQEEINHLLNCAQEFSEVSKLPTIASETEKLKKLVKDKPTAMFNLNFGNWMSECFRHLENHERSSEKSTTIEASPSEFENDWNTIWRFKFKNNGKRTGKTYYRCSVVTCAAK